MTDQEIRDEVRSLGYPADLEDAEIDAAVRHVLRDIKFEYPVMVLGVFNLVACQQDYDLFNPVPFPETSQGVFPGGLRAYELLRTGVSDVSGLDVFGIAPWFQGTFPWPGTLRGNSFYTPGDWTIWDSDWAAWMGRFVPQEFEQLSDLSGAPIRIYPVPSDSCAAILRFTKARTEAEIRDEDESWFLKLVEAQSARIIANKLSLCAGISFAEAIRDEGKTAAYWEREAGRLREEGWSMFNARRRDQISPAQRSHGP